jgi:ATP-binding protein involved in chromosome partitioning
MSVPTREMVEEALSNVAYPGFKRDIVSFGLVRDVSVEDGRVTIRLALKSRAPELLEELKGRIEGAVGAVEGVQAIELTVGSPAPSRLPAAGQEQPQKQQRPPGPNARHIIGVASGKGGVGKSTVAVNMAVALAESGKRVGFLDADVHGPSAPLLFGLVGQRPEQANEEGKPLPLEAFGVKIMSMGFFVERDNAVIWRGPIVGNFIKQLLGDVAWGDLDVLVIDFPPGTGDAQLTISQTIRMTGSIIVTTPNELALIDAIKGVAMFHKVEVPVLGVVENMAYFRCGSCGEATEIFGESRVGATAKEQGVELLGRIPIDPEVVRDSDAGRPVVLTHPESEAAQVYRSLAETAWSAAERSSEKGEGLGSFLDRFGGEG